MLQMSMEFRSISQPLDTFYINHFYYNYPFHSSLKETIFSLFTNYSQFLAKISLQENQYYITICNKDKTDDKENSWSGTFKFFNVC